MVILQKHIDFLIDRHAWFAALDNKPEDFGELFSTEWTRSVMSSVVSKGAAHMTQVFMHRLLYKAYSSLEHRATHFGTCSEIGNLTY